ncbi:MAG: tyrosine--tRNA ligase [Bdellovibrionales bacterium]|nr:tyrosine--tRNA ligase [Bdellovibrionales bacterium]
MADSFLKGLRARKLIHDVSHETELENKLASGSVPFYCGFDPTADSLHVGSMLPLTMMRRLQRLGHKPILVLGSGTGMIGDPSGKSEERTLLDDDAIAHNLEGIEAQARAFFSFEGDNAAVVVRNDEWLRKLDLIAFLRDVGKHFSVNAMMAKDSVRARLEDRDQGISYTEFSYMLLQAYDFYWLYKEHGCVLQIGGSDQWGNITAGIDFIRRKTGNDKGQAFGLTFPLVTTSSGTKFGKTEQGTVWLDPKRTSPYRFYQYWLNTQDSDVVHFLRMFTELSDQEIAALEKQVAEDPGKREAQKSLARIMCDLVHGNDETVRAENATQVLFGGKLTDVDDATLADIFSDVPSTEVKAAELSAGIAIVDLLKTCGLSKSNGEARRTIDGGGLYLNNERVSDSAMMVTSDCLATDSMLVLRSGKKKYHLVKIVSR